MEEKIEAELERLNLNPTDRGRYWTIHCPFHEDRNKSAVCFKDGWIHCYTGCQRTHINKLVEANIVPRNYAVEAHQTRSEGDFTEMWVDLDPLDENVKGVPYTELNKRGWRKCPSGIFIPYFNVDRSKVKYYQIRRPAGSEPRFYFPKGISPICYGYEMLPKMQNFLPFTEGSRDSVILGMAGIPAVALPSASSVKILNGMVEYAKKNNLTLVAVSDRDEAGDKMMERLSGSPLIDARTTVGKDIGDTYEEKGLEYIKSTWGWLAPRITEPF